MSIFSLMQNKKVRAAALVVRVVGLGAFVLVTNGGVLVHLALLQGQHRWTTIVGFLLVWGLSLAALLIVTLQRRFWVRALWGATIAASAAVAIGYRQASGGDFGTFDAISLWSVRHEASRAMDFYASDMWLAVLVCIGGFLVVALPPGLRFVPLQRWISRLALAPVLPVALIAAIIVMYEGGGTTGLPAQFAPLSIGLVSAAKIATAPSHERRAVTWTPGVRKARHVVMLVDESLRGDYIDWTRGNPYTPELARLRSRLVDFGPAASAGNCSQYSNALLRFGAARDHLGSSVLTNPTLWQYAKRAGFRTVFIDAQSAFNRNPGKLQNFMTTAEAGQIDNLVTMPDGVPAPQLDDRLLDTVIQELRSPGPVFIYANKNGAHFPYDHDYPASETLFRPTMTEQLQAQTRDDIGNRTLANYVLGGPIQGRIDSYRNAVRWSVDRFFKRLFAEADLTDTVVLFTSDHGQVFNPDRLTHCSVEDPDPREGLVPLFVAASDPALQQRFAVGAKESRDHASHFSIAPTLFELFGYAKPDIAKAYGPSLFERNDRQPGFTSGDIFGLFSANVRWHPLDLSRRYLEPEATATPSRTLTETSAPQQPGG